MRANLQLLEGDFKTAKNMYRNMLQTHTPPEVTSKILNNLAYASW